MNRQNRPDRDSLLLLAAMHFADRPDQLGIKVRNLSPLGMMAECPVRPICGERVLVELRNIGWIDGTVAGSQTTASGWSSIAKLIARWCADQ